MIKREQRTLDLLVEMSFCNKMNDVVTVKKWHFKSRITADTKPALEAISKSCFLSTNTAPFAGLLTNGDLD